LTWISDCPLANCRRAVGIEIVTGIELFLSPFLSLSRWKRVRVRVY
jgi:hypothetical protein